MCPCSVWVQGSQSLASVDRLADFNPISILCAIRRFSVKCPNPSVCRSLTVLERDSFSFEEASRRSIVCIGIGINLDEEIQLTSRGMQLLVWLWSMKWKDGGDSTPVNLFFRVTFLQNPLKSTSCASRLHLRQFVYACAADARSLPMRFRSV